MDPIVRAVALTDRPHRLRRRGDVPQPRPESECAALPISSAQPKQDAPPPSAVAGLGDRERAALRAEMESELARERDALRLHADVLALETATEAERQGYAAGEAKGIERGQAALLDAARRLESAAEQIGRARSDLLAAAEDDLVEIVFAATCQMVGISVVEQGQIRATVSHWLAQARARQGATVRLHPDDYALLMGAGVTPDIDSGVAFTPDSEVGLGGCVVETAQGALDGRFEHHLAQLTSALAATRSARREAQPS